MIFLASWTNPARIRDWLVGWVARLPARVQTKLLAAFLTIAGLLIVLGAVGLQVLNGVNGRTEELIKLQRKIAAYQQVQHDTTNQLYSISTALLLQDDRMLDAALRQLNQFGYDLDRMEFVAKDEAELLGQVRKDYDRLAATVTHVVELIRGGRTVAARQSQLTLIIPLADRLERQTNQLVNIAEADMVAGIDATGQAYRTSRIIVIAFALGSLLLALGLGYVISWSLITPVREIEARLRRIAAGEFSERVKVINRDEFGGLAGNVNQTSEQLGRLYQEIEARTEELSEALDQQTATAEVLKAISRSTFDLDLVLRTLVESAARLCNTGPAQIWRRDGDVYRYAAGQNQSAEYLAIEKQQEIRPGRNTLVGRIVLEKQAVQILDFWTDPEYGPKEDARLGNLRSALGVPLLRGGEPIGTFCLARNHVEPFTDRQVALITTFADQAVIAIENVRLFEEVQTRNRELSEALEQQTATGAILRAIAASPTDIQPVLSAVAESAAKLCNAYDGAILLREGESLAWRAHYGPIPIDFASWPIGRDWVTGRAFVDAKPVHVHDLSQAADEFPAGQKMALRLGHRTMLAVPLLREAEAIGALIIRRLEVRPFSDKQIELVTTFADQAVIAIENVRLFEEVQAKTSDLSESLRQQTATADVLKVISRSAFDLDAVLTTLIESATTLCGVHEGVIYLRDGDVLKARAQFNCPPPYLEFLKSTDIWANPKVFLGRAFFTGEVVQIADTNDTELILGAAPEVGNFRAVLGVPMLRDSRVEGVFTLGNREPGLFTQRQTELVQTFADQAVIAIENVRLFEEVQARTSELARSVGELKALGEVSQAVNSTLDLKTVLETIVAKAVQLSETDAGAIYVFNKAAQNFRLRATYGMSQELIAAVSGQTIGLHDPGPGEAARRRAPVQVSDLSEGVSTPVHKIVLEAGYRSLLVVPLLRPNKIVGALVVRRKTPGQFQDSTVHLMETFAAQSVVAIQNARLFSEIEEKSHQLEIASRHKSQFLANMSHELRTPLNSVLGFTEMLADGLYGELPEKAVATLSRVQANGRHLLGLINDVLDLSKIEAGQLQLVIDNYSAGQIVKTVAAATEPLARAKRLELRTDIAEGMPLGRGDERRLTQVLLNLAGNAVKFTDTGSVEIVAEASNGSFEFTVRDTGPGIAPEFQARIFEEFQQVDDSSTRQKGGTGLGLAISKRIVEMHGGTIGVQSAPGAGSAFRVTIPVRADERTRAA